MTVDLPGATSIEQAVEQRGETDTRPSYYVHVVLPPLIVLGTLLISLASVMAMLTPLPLDPQVALDRLTDRFVGGLVVLNVLALLVATTLSYLGLYRVLQRRNDHLARDRILRRGLIDHCRRIAEGDGGERAGEHLEDMERVHNEALMEERERPAAVHVTLQVLLLSLWSFYMLYVLLKDVPSHARRQARFVRSARSLFEDAGLGADSIPPIEPIEQRSYLLALGLLVLVPVVLVGAGVALLSSIAGPVLVGLGLLAGLMAGAVVRWWIYEDPVEHFNRQWTHEDALVEIVTSEEPLGDGPHPGPTAAQPSDEEPSRTAAPPTPEVAQEPSGGEAEESEPAPEPEFTVWACEECEKQYKVPPQRPVRVTCKNCGNKEILEE